MHIVAALDLEGVMLHTIIHGKSHLSLIHIALILDQHAIVDFLLDHSGKHIAQVCAETEECKKLTPLYIAIQHVSVLSVKHLVWAVPTDGNEQSDCINQ